jgi:bacillithiol system protein YtxJ
VKITEIESFEELASRSQDALVVVFKHSPTCPISAAAYVEMSRFDGDVAVVEVQRARSLSQEIERRTGVAHESPQVLVLRKGKVVWNASHWKVKADEVQRAVKNANGAAGAMDRKVLDDRGASN